MNPLFQYIPDEIDVNKTYCCAIEYGKGFTHICLLDTHHCSVVAQEYFQWTLNEEVLQQPNHSSIIVFCQKQKIPFRVYLHQPIFTLIPAAYKADMVYKDILFLLTGKKDGVLASENIDSLSIVNIYAADVDFAYPFIEAISPINNKRHFITHWLQGSLKQIGEQNRIDVIFYPHYFLITIWKEGHLQLIKYIFYKTNEDVLYHLLDLTDYYSFDIRSISIQLFGTVDKSSNLYKMLGNYFDNMNVASISHSWSISEILSSKCPTYLSASLLSLVPCASFLEA